MSVLRIRMIEHATTQLGFLIRARRVSPWPDEQGVAIAKFTTGSSPVHRPRGWACRRDGLRSGASIFRRRKSSPRIPFVLNKPSDSCSLESARDAPCVLSGAEARSGSQRRPRARAERRGRRPAGDSQRLQRSPYVPKKHGVAVTDNCDKTPSADPRRFPAMRSTTRLSTRFPPRFALRLGDGRDADRERRDNSR
jgi:hypothetical protein